MEQLRKKAVSLGADSFDYSRAKGKRFQVKYDGKTISFGSKSGSTYYDHGDSKKRDAWYARHSKVLNAQGKQVIELKTSPSYWSAKILW